MLARLCVVLSLATASAFVAQPVGLPVRVGARGVAARMQFGTGNTDGNGYDESGNPNFFLSPIAGGSKDYPYGQYELDTSGELPAKFLAFLIVVGLPVAFAVGIATADV